MELDAADIAVEILAPGVAISVLLTAIKQAVPAIPVKVLPLASIFFGVVYAVAVAINGDVVESNPVAVGLLGITVGAEASALQAWLRPQKST